jgi:cytoskeletal protein CcmA (bactofilin family)
MWKPRPDEKPATSNPATQPTLAPQSTFSPGPNKETRSLEPAKTSEHFRADVAAHIGKSVLVKGELSGSEDLYLDGEVEGTIELNNHTLVVGPNGRVRANISAREVVLHGRAEGNVTAKERVELKKSCVLSGDITTQRIVIEDGAFFKGSIDLQKENKAEPHKAAAAAAAAGAGIASVVASAQTSFLEHK